jgi:hypothetical protein
VSSFRQILRTHAVAALLIVAALVGALGTAARTDPSMLVATFSIAKRLQHAN